MRYIKTAAIFIIVGLLVVTAACARGERPGQTGKTVGREETVMADFAALQQNKAALPELIAFVDSHISEVSSNNGAAMVTAIEKMQKEQLPALQDRYTGNEALQKELAKSQGNPDTVTANKEVQDLALQTKNSGYKLENAEGIYFPVIDYSRYKTYSAAVTPDMAAYIDIMAAEAERMPVKDAALKISWAEICRRALKQEQFLKEYGNSVKAEDVRELLNQYATFAMYGANNTPLFDYDTKAMQPDAQTAYSGIPFDKNNGSFSKGMSEFIAIAGKNGYRLTDEVQNYRNKLMEEII